MMLWLLALVVAVLAACAIATGTNSVATVGTKSEIKREVAASAPVIEEILLQEKK